jgi:hypothetical protein
MRPVNIHGVKSGKSQPAQRTAARFIEWRSAHERSPAGDAEKLGVDRSGFRQATAADRYAGDFVKGFAANPAIVGEKNVEKRAKALIYGAHDATGREIGEQATTREDPPPPTPSVYNTGTLESFTRLSFGCW